MKIDYKDIRDKKPCSDGYIWFLETFGKEKIELCEVIKLAPTNYAVWLKEKFEEQPFSKTDFHGEHAWRNKDGDIFEFHINGMVCRAEKFRDVKEFPSGSFLPVENVIDTERYIVIGSVKLHTYCNDEDEYLYFYDTKFATSSNIFLLCNNIKKIYWSPINLGGVFFDIPLYAHFDNKMCRCEKLKILIRNGKLKQY